MNSVKPVMKKELFVFSFFLLFFLVNLGAAYAENAGWSWSGESTDGLTGRFSGTVNISTDRAVGKYSVKVTTKDDVYDWGHYGFSNTFNFIDTDQYSKVSIWVKPGPGAKVLRFWIWDHTEGRTEALTSDKNHDGYYKVGEDLESGKWNNLILDLKQTDFGGVSKNASNLQMITNDFSTWYWDEAKVIYSPVAKLNFVTNSYTQTVDGAVRYKVISPDTFNTTPTVLVTQTAPNIFPKGKVDKIFINSSYVNTNGITNQLQSSKKLISGINASKIVVSGDGKRIFYLNSNDSNKLYLFDQNTKVNKKLADHTDIKEIKTDFLGSYVYFIRNYYYWSQLYNNYGTWNELSYYSIDNNNTNVITCLGKSSFFDIQNYGAVVYYNPKDGYFYHRWVGSTIASRFIGPIVDTTSLTISAQDYLFLSYNYGSNGTIKRYLHTPGIAWKESEIISSPKLLNINQMLSNKDGTLLYIRVNSIIYSLDVSSKVLKQLNIENVGNMIKISNDNRLFYTDIYGDFVVYDSNSDTNTRIRPNNVSNTAFSVDNPGSTIIYNESTGIFSATIKPVVESSINLFNNPLMLDNDNDGLPDSYYKGGYGASTLTTTKLLPEQGVKGNIWRIYQSGASEGILYQGSNAPNGFQPNTTYTVSFKVRQNLIYRDRAEFFVLNVNGSGQYIQANTNLAVIGSDVGNVFKRVSYTFTTTVDFPANGKLELRFDHNGSDSGYYDIAEVQIEQNETSTPFVYSSGSFQSKPDKYLLSFDGRQSWVTFKDGKWQKVTNNSTPNISVLQVNGMTSDEVNALDADDFAQLYEDGQEIYSVDVAVLFQTPDPSISPQINGITVTLNGEGVKGTSLQYPKQQADYNSSNWRLIRKIYPIELQPKEAEVRYFLSNDDGTNLKSYKDGLWTTYQPTLLNNPKDNWSDIIQFGMTAEELRSIPSEQLNNLLPANKISVVYVTEVDDFLTDEYSSKITIDFVENLFVSNNLVLKITLTDGSIREFSGLSKDQVEDFMNWINERQYNRGPIFYTIKTNGTTPGVVQSNKFINYYMIQSVDVDEMQ